MRRLLLPIFVLVFATTAARSDGLKDLKGTWVASEGQLGGEKVPDEFIKAISLTITDGKYSVTVGEQKETGTFTIDATKKPMTMDISAEDGANKGKKILAIYELSGDTMKVCYKLDDSGRPKEFKSTKDDKQFFVVYKRKK
jgi:uncharacterized protein (TIGR03067 family)